MGTGRRVPVEVESDAYISADDEERLYSDVLQNLRKVTRAEIQYESDSDLEEEEDRPPVEWDPENPHKIGRASCRERVCLYV